MLKAVHTLLCEVHDMGRAVAFYRGVLGLELEMETPYWSALRLGEDRLGLHPPFNGRRQGTTGGWILCAEVEDIGAVRAALEDAGVATGEFHDTPGGVIMDFADPDGNRLQAIQVGARAADL